VAIKHACERQRREIYKRFFIQKLDGKRGLGNRKRNGKIILKWILRKRDVGVWMDSFSAQYKPVAGCLKVEMKIGSRN
jgi:hypothetical protein